MKRTTRILAIAILVGLATILLTSCGNSGPVKLTIKENGSAQKLSKGQQLVLELPVNPNTGYRWVVDGSVPAQLKQVGEPKVLGPGEVDFTNGPTAKDGANVWTFAGESAGDAVLKMKYVPASALTGPGSGKYTVNVTVR